MKIVVVCKFLNGGKNIDMSFINIDILPLMFFMSDVASLRGYTDGMFKAKKKTIWEAGEPNSQVATGDD